MTRPDEAALDTVLSLYAAIDAGRATLAESLFAPDAVLITGRGRAEGIEAIRGFLAAREADTGRRTVHVLANTCWPARDAVAARLEAVLLVHVPGDHGQGWVVEHAAPVQHDLRLDEGTWRITGRRPGSWQLPGGAQPPAAVVG